MTELNKAHRDGLYATLREAAIVVDEAHQQAMPSLKNGDANFDLATGVIRSMRRGVDGIEDRETVVRWLKEGDEALSLIGGSAADAVHKARTLIGDAHYRLASGR
jgi:hypothetical protein